MNTRLQVEHPVTEAIFGVDLVREQIRVAAGAGLSVRAGRHQGSTATPSRPHQCRESRTFAPHPARITHYHAPGGLGVRIDSGVYDGLQDPALLRQPDRQADRAWPRPGRVHDAARRALDEFVVDGINTTIPLFKDLLANPDIANGDYDIHWLEKFLAAKAGKKS
jgi:acetyl-CoA carboxylase biotin carboxylase subunit